ncbi:cation:proton antiporter [Terrimonas pollutisoli]|uniref:cation:proton antiporter n=1 Tax=Terrimonas pollutisoli TaxID=3034147 RepID=UPI0023EAFE31|nr:cation:proton antiporter [Terrimonas sp. H1YJ31]
MNLLEIRFPLQDPVPIFAIVLFIILLAPILLRKLRIPSIIGLILAGMAIGDHGFNIIAKGSIDLFGKAGLLYIMFLAGLELDMAEFKKNKYKSMVFGFFTFAIPMGLGFLLCYQFLHFNFMGSLLVSSMFATHTLVAYPLASRMGITKNEAITVAVGGTIITDTAVLLILAVITGAADGQLNQAFWLKLGGSFLLFSFGVLFGFPFIGRWFFKRIKDDQTTHFIFVLAMVFLAAWLAELAGVEGIIGAFLAGLALNQLIPHTSALMNRIEFTGNAIFIPFFLISVGMIVDLRVLLKGPDALIIAGTLTAMAVFTKWLAAFFTQKIFGYTSTQRNVIFGLSTSHAAATIAVILIGFNIGLIDENVLNGTIILILVTCMVGSFVTANAGKRLAISEANKLPEVVNEQERLLIPFVDIEKMDELVDFAVMIKGDTNKLPIDLLSVVQDDAEAKGRVKLNQKKLEKVIKHGAETDTKLQVLNRVDLNMSNGVARAVKERFVSDVVLQWSEKGGSTTNFLVNSLFGTNTQNIIDTVWETVYICNFQHPVNTARKIFLLVTPNAQYEIGFKHWLKKMLLLSRQAGARLVVCCDPATRQAFQDELRKRRITVEVNYSDFETADDFSVLSGQITRDDLIVIVNARKGTLSYQSFMDTLQTKILKQFTENNFILLYPEQTEVEFLESGVQSGDLTLTPIQEQIDNLNKLGKAVKKIFNPGSPKSPDTAEETQ